VSGTVVGPPERRSGGPSASRGPAPTIRAMRPTFRLLDDAHLDPLHAAALEGMGRVIEARSPALA
jgi:hypothetical protein